MRIAMYQHGTKGALIRAALESAGHRVFTDDRHSGEVAVMDHDCRIGYGRIRMLDSHEVVVLYPHGGNVGLWWDGREPHPHTRLTLVPAPGHSQVMAMYGYPVPTVPIGFTMSDLAPPRLPCEVRRVLYAPCHPMSDGYLDTLLRDENRRVLTELVELARNGLDVQVSCWGDISHWGLFSDPAVSVVQEASVELIDSADVVIATGTVAHIALARGSPLVMLGADIPPDDSQSGPPEYPPNWDRYASLMRYPLATEDGPLDKLLELACLPDPRVDRYRARFVGDAFDAETTVALIENAASFRQRGASA